MNKLKMNNKLVKTTYKNKSNQIYGIKSIIKLIYFIGL